MQKHTLSAALEGEGAVANCGTASDTCNGQNHMSATTKLYNTSAAALLAIRDVQFTVLPGSGEESLP